RPADVHLIMHAAFEPRSEFTQRHCLEISTISKLLAPPVQLAPEKRRVLHLANSRFQPRHVYRSIRICWIFEDWRGVRDGFVTTAALWLRYYVFARPRFNLSTAFFR